MLHIFFIFTFLSAYFFTYSENHHSILDRSLLNFGSNYNFQCHIRECALWSVEVEVCVAFLIDYIAQRVEYMSNVVYHFYEYIILM
jgi:flagellar biosynthesis protein FlhB